ncbi:cupin domain-containing protein [Streptomyces sp. NPDC058374]|uniref:cupin domain-containing protein n=1 Tax=unclassified Streptomyces TaxID=2593676 RepID=UPI00364E4316
MDTSPAHVPAPPRAPHPCPLRLDEALAKVDALWSPRVVTTLNDYDVKVARLQGAYVWHAHQDTDELFLVVDGTLHIDLRDAPDAGERTVTLGTGALFTVPRGVEHRPHTESGAQVVLLEPSGTLSTGDYAGEVPDHIDATTGRK